MRSVEQAVSRALVVYDKTQKQQQKPSGSSQKQKKKKSVRNPSMMVTSMPASIGTTMSGMRPSISASGGVIRVRGREFVVTLPENNQTNWYLGAYFPIHPSYLRSTVLANYARSYSRFKFNGGAIHFITRQPTSATGELLMYYKRDAGDVSLAYNDSDFLSSALSMSDTILGPIWCNHTLRLPGIGSAGDTNPLMDPDINDNLKGEVSVLTQSAVVDNAGFLVFDYDFSFFDPMYTLHSTIIPVTTGPTDVKTFVDTNNEVINSQVIVTLDTEFSTVANGTVFKLVLNSTGTTYATGTTAATSLRNSTSGSNSLFTLKDGTTFYGAVIGTSMYLYPTLAAAKSLSDTSFVSYNQSVAFKTTWAFIAYMVQAGNSLAEQQT